MRLIDADKIIFAEIDEVGGEYEPYLGCSKSQIDHLPTVKAIPKDQYETRLKADMVDMLEQLDLEIQEQIAYMGDGEEANGMKRADNLVKDKINTIKQSIWQDNYNGPKEVEQ